jgi:toxin YoeB
LAKRDEASKGRPPKGQPQGPRSAVFHPEFREDLRFWIERDRRMALRVLELVEATLREPLAGIGKPEPLKHELTGAWSRRVTGEHRLVYLVRGDRVEFLQARYHY